ncbi:RNA polymerase subunit sigma-70 [Methylobacterium sp. C33D]
METEENSRLRHLLGRLSEAAAASETAGQVPAGFGTALLDAVPDLRRRARTLARDAIAGDVQGDDLVRLTLLRAWERRAEFRPGTGMPAWLDTILRTAPFNGRVAYRLATPAPADRSAALRAGSTHGRGAERVPDGPIP